MVRLMRIMLFSPISLPLLFVGVVYLTLPGPGDRAAFYVEEPRRSFCNSPCRDGSESRTGARTKLSHG